jgi:hypothetical protein
MPLITRDVAVQLAQNYLRASRQYQAACLALPDFVDHMGFQFSCGRLRDQLVRKDRHTSDFTGTSKEAKKLRNDLRRRLLSFREVAPKEAIELSASRFTDNKLQQLVTDARDRSPSNNDLTNRTLLLFLTLGLACRGVGGLDGQSAQNCNQDVIFHYLPNTSERDHWPQTQKMLKALGLKGIKCVSDGLHAQILNIENLLCTSPRCNSCHGLTTELFKRHKL